MGTIVKRGSKLRAVVRINGRTLTKSFDTARAADIWIAATETTLRKTDTVAGYVNQLTLSDVLIRHRDELLTGRPYVVEKSVNTRFANQFVGVGIGQLTREWWVKSVIGWKVSPSSALRYVCSITAALRAGEDLEWGIKVDWQAHKEAMRAMTRQKLVAVGKARSRRVSVEEVAAMRAVHLESGKPMPLNDMIDFALATAMRVGEITRITWADLDQRRKMIIIRDRKDPKNKAGNDQEIPLLGEALAIIKRQPKTQSRIFPYHVNTVGDAFSLTAQLARIENVHFHDLRHEAITRLFEQGFAIDEVALMSGHKKWETLRNYTHIKAESLHQGPRQRRAA